MIVKESVKIGRNLWVQVRLIADFIGSDSEEQIGTSPPFIRLKTIGFHQIYIASKQYSCYELFGGC